MKTPDKIYIPNKPVEISAAYSSRTVGNDVEYIRKDALMEWAKEWQKELPEGLGASMVHHVLNEVIKKIESL